MCVLEEGVVLYIQNFWGTTLAVIASISCNKALALHKKPKQSCFCTRESAQNKEKQKEIRIQKENKQITD